MLPAVRRFYQDNNNTTTTTTMTTTPIKDLVTAALIFSRPYFFTEKEYDSAESAISSVVTKQDHDRAYAHSAASARILAEEVQRLRKALNRTINIIEEELKTN